MKKRPRSSKSQHSQGSQMLTKAGSLAPEEVPGPENTTGLPMFPAELLLEILSYCESDPDPALDEEYNKKDADAHFANRERLMALSQTCRNLRLFFLPYLWNRIEVFSGMRAPTGEVLNSDEHLAFELVRQLEIVTIRDPDLARYVNVVDVMIKNYCVRNVLRELARCLALFPNMHTLKLDHTITTVALVDQAITYGFGRHKSFPQIRSILLPRNCNGLLKWVPGARYVYFREPQQTMGPWLPNFSACCPLLENIEFFIPSKLTFYPHIVQKFSNIKDLTLQFNDCRKREIQPDFDFILSNCRHLKIIKMRRLVSLTLEVSEWFISQAKEALLGLQKNDKEEKTIVLYFRCQPNLRKEIITLPWPPALTSKRPSISPRPR